ncbi:GSU2403 family nucleotidyltransferase fold protein [Pararhizobium sp. LjRoot235]|uniref:GSU2403 family nucleotidyltransferase fold protein n=1 Tax=Pararhizobium sp. LjRoot235 TaxID=3342291 RepID=UPI003ECEB521
MSIAFADLVESAHEKAFNARFPDRGTFHKLKRGDKEYWYHVMRDPTAPSGRRSCYAGVVGDPEVDALVERHRHEHARHKLQKETASMLRRAGLPAPDPMEGRLAQAFQRAGLFQAGAILVGSVAYQAYGGILGVKLSGDLHRTLDIDLAQDREIALHVGHTGQKLEDFQDILTAVDPSFAPKFNSNYPIAGPRRYENAGRYKVDLLTAHKNSYRDRRAPLVIPNMPGATLQPLDLMEFLIKNPIRSALLFEEGVAVVVPDPVRCALHKATISQMRGLSGDAGKDVQDRIQAAELIKGIEHVGRTSELAEAWSELWRDKKLRAFVLRGILALPVEVVDIVARSAIRFGVAPFRDGEAPAVTFGKLSP